MIFVDTAYWLALFNPREELHARAHAWADAVSDRVVVTEHVLRETVNDLSMPIDRPKAHAIIAHVRRAADCDIAPATADLLEAGLELHESRADKSWSLTDCISFVVMKRFDVQRALTHDHHFEQAGFEALLRREP